MAPLAVAPGSGPRHIDFLVTEDKTYMYLISELANTITGFQVSYGANSMAFKQIFLSSTHGDNSMLPNTTSAAEVTVSVSDDVSYFFPCISPKDTQT